MITVTFIQLGNERKVVDMPDGATLEEAFTAAGLVFDDVNATLHGVNLIIGDENRSQPLTADMTILVAPKVRGG